MKPTLGFSFGWMPGGPKWSKRARFAPLTACELPVSRWHLCEEQVNWKETKILNLDSKQKPSFAGARLGNACFCHSVGVCLCSLPCQKKKKKNPNITRNPTERGSYYFQLLRRGMGSHPMPPPASRVLLNISSWIWGVSWSQVSSVPGREGFEEETACSFAPAQATSQNPH